MNLKNTGVNSSGKSSLWQVFSYRKQLKNLIESGVTVAEIEERSQQFYEESKNGITTEPARK
ncbi:Uncharacterised protein [Actinobacillus ureae]|uniref:hypothetical protein n=1 Tax=Actinobacillus ureae TaxID=723 RepID=UPI000E167B62|nr:hypothetical protein [Actinobacillus ureae]SUT85403.1 Uncharacterised protein [Actinobacillus ureae]SUU42521.1 Uncharacterised protein [Actinobacillus ureae]